MYSPPWGSDPFDLSAYLARGQKHRRSYHIPFLPPPQPMPYSTKPRSGLNPFYPKAPKLSKYARFSDLETPSSSNVSLSEWDDSYTLDTDSYLSPLPRLPSRHRYAQQNPVSRPDILRVSVLMLRHRAQEMRLRSDEVLFLPPLVHLRIVIALPSAREQLRIAVAGCVAFEDVTRQAVQCYAGKGVPYRAQVEQRGRMCEVPSDAVLEDLAHRGEVYRDGGREMRVEIVVGEDNGWSVRDRFGGRGLSRAGDAEVETVRKRVISRTRYTKAKH